MNLYSTGNLICQVFFYPSLHLIWLRLILSALLIAHVSYGMDFYPFCMEIMDNFLCGRVLPLPDYHSNSQDTSLL